MGKITIEENLKKNGYYLATVHGDSMMPLLRQNIDMVKIVPVSNTLKKLDLPLYKRPTGEYVLHRIIAVKDGYYIICGDNRFLKEKVPFSWVVGVTDSIFRGEKEFSVHDLEYIKYVKKIRRTFWIRRIARKIKKILAIPKTV